MIYKQVAPQILDAIKKANNILLISHEKPDGDTLGASLAVAQFLDKQGKTHVHFCADKHAAYFSYLPKIENIINDSNKIELTDHDLIITIDCGDIKRTGLAENLLALKDQLTLINIDHHVTNNNFGRHNLVVPTASSTSEIIFNFFAYNNIEVDKYMATSLLTGILTDTMNFTNAATTQESLKIAAELLNKGARVNQIVSSVTKNKNLNSLKLWGEVLSRLEYNPQYNFAYTVITQNDLQENNISAEEAGDGLANFLSTIEDIDFILVLIQDNDNLVKASLRTTKDHIDVAQMAQAFGGGGHQKAAGFSIKGQLLKTKEGWQVA